MRNLSAKLPILIKPFYRAIESATFWGRGQTLQTTNWGGDERWARGRRAKKKPERERLAQIRKSKFGWQWPTLACRNHILPSALADLTAGFEMGPGVPPPLISPTKLTRYTIYTDSPHNNQTVVATRCTMQPSHHAPSHAWYTKN